MASDIEIAQQAKLERISNVAARLGIAEEHLEPYGHTKAKLSLDYVDSLAGRPDGKLILVTAMTPTPAGEGKTTTTVGLGDALNLLGKKAVITRSGIKYVDRTDFVPELDAPDVLAEPAKPKRPPKPRQINDPKHVAAARELRDRYLEQINADASALPVGKYDVSRALEAPSVKVQVNSTLPKQLPEAA